MKALKIALCAATASLAMAGSAFAEEGTFSFNIGAATDYVFRGVSQTDEGGQIFGGADYGYGPFYAGVWASNVDFGDGTDAEVDLYAGYKPTLGDVTFDLGAIYYGYVNDSGDWAQWEFKGAASAPAGPVTLGVAGYYSPDYTGVGTDDSVYVEVNAAVTPAENWAVTAALGKQSVDFEGGGSDDYTTWNIGVGYTFAEKFTADLRWHDTNIDGSPIADGRVVFSLKAVLP
ncbi:MAG: TorF family putative porin [Pseudomonadota bacterium]